MDGAVPALKTAAKKASREAGHNKQVQTTR